MTASASTTAWTSSRPPSGWRRPSASRRSSRRAPSVAARYDVLLGDMAGSPSPRRRRPAMCARGSSTSCASTPRIDRDAVMAAMQARGVACKPYLPAVHLQPFYRSLGHRAGRVPGRGGDRSLDARAAVPHAARAGRSGLRRRLPRRRPRLSDARGASAAGRPRDVGRELSRAPAAGRRVTAWLEFPAARADLARRRRAPPRRPPRDRRSRRAPRRRSSTTAAAPPRSRATASPRRSPATSPSSTRSPTAGTPTSASGHASAPAAPARRADGAARRGAPPPYALAGPEAVWYTRRALCASDRPTSRSPRARWSTAPDGRDGARGRRAASP